ncbi:MAG TPA: hypothetical protein VKV39_08960 [Candidatus Sulfotelmatobacter sp.]|nr:hypothetical protein [Candidatus Sulfotelmatobacter sp.]
MKKSANEESDRMMLLLQELAVLKQVSNTADSGSPSSGRRRKEIGREIKALAAEKKKVKSS